MWQEASTITGLPVIRNVDDATIPPSVTYEEDRLKALHELFAVVEAWPHLTPAGQLTARPKEWPAQVDVFRGVVSAPRAMTSERVYHRVVVEGKALDDTVIRAVSEIRTGFLTSMKKDLTKLSWRVINRIQKLIEAKEMTDAEVIARSGIPRNTFYRKMRGDTPLNTDDLEKIGRALEVSPYDLFNDSPSNVTELRPRVGGAVDNLPAAARTTDPDDARTDDDRPGHPRRSRCARGACRVRRTVRP